MFLVIPGTLIDTKDNTVRDVRASKKPHTKDKIPVLKLRDKHNL